MSDTIFFIVPGEPVAKQRPRTWRNKKTGKSITFTPPKTTRYEEWVKAHALRAAALAKWQRPKEEDRFAISLEVFLGTGRHKDLDNIAKSIMDGLQPEIVADDWQFRRIEIHRVMKCPEPGVAVALTRVREVWFFKEDAEKDQAACG